MFQNKVILDLLKMCSVLPVFVVAPAMAFEYPYTVNEGETLTVNGTIEGVVDTENRALTNKGTTIISGATIKNNNSTNKDGGGAVANSGNGLMNISDTSFVGNSAKYFGAFFSGTKTTGLTISDSRFEDNTALEGGAAGLFHGGKVTSTVFKNNTSTNTAENSDGAGALFLGAVSRTELNDVTFTENESETRGGAIAMRSYDMGDNTDARLDIISSKFISNVAGTNGGAIDNSFYSSKQDVTAVYIANTEFETNSAEYGGAIYNHGEKDKGGNASSLMSVWSNYTGNTATNGGAIYNMADAGLTLKGGNFKENIATEQGGAIYNAGNVKAANITFEKNAASSNGGAISNIGTMVVGGKFLKNSATSYGGAIYNKGDLTISDNTIFDGNTADSVGGAIANALGTSMLTVGADVEFKNNISMYDGGAIGNYKGAAIVSGTKFISNHAQTQTEDINAIGGGAMSLGAESYTAIANAVFDKNTSGYDGGAIGTRNPVNATGMNNDAAELTITSSIFTNNSAMGNVTSHESTGNFVGGNGGAIANHFYKNIVNDNGVIVSGSSFVGNKAKNNGGAIYNGGETDKNLKFATMIITDSYFEKNTAQNGGAIYNMGKLTLNGTNVFSDNNTGGELNDIYNGGELNISGNLTVDGGIVNDGTINFVKGSAVSFNSETNKIVSGTSGVINGETALVIANGTNNAHIVFEGDRDGFALTDNSLYNIKTVADGYDITKKSSAEQVALLQQTGLSDSAAKTIAAISGVKTTGNVAADALFADLTAAAQSGDTAAAEAINEVAKTINPESEAVVQSAAVSTQNTINTLTAGRMDLGRNGGDLSLTSGGVWVQGLFNRAKSGDKFSANTRGISAGIDGTINKDIMLGIGYAYGHSDVSAKTRDTDIDNHSVFLYGQYKPTQWYANATLNYTTSGYKENGSVAGLLAVNSEYRANAFGANVATGYELPFGLTPELGLRYLHVRTNDYTNSLGFHTDAKNTNFLTGIIGARYGFDIAASDAWLVRPELSAAAKYDLVSDGNTATVALPGVDAYTLDVERLKRFGGEFGVGLAMSYYGFDLSLSYYIDVREDYTSQTGMAKFRYNF